MPQISKNFVSIGKISASLTDHNKSGVNIYQISQTFWRGSPGSATV